MGGGLKHKILRVPVSKEKLAQLTPEERVLFFLFGYAANQLTLFQKLVIFSTNVLPEQSDEQVLAAAQTQMLARIAIGLITEAYEVVHKRFLGRPIGKEYVKERLDEGGLEALERLKQYFGKSNLLTTLRTDFAFHHPFDPKVESAFASAAADTGLDQYWNWYMAESPLNFFYLPSDMVILHGMMQATGKGNLAAAQEEIMTAVRTTINDLIEFISAFLVAVWRKYFGQEFEATICADIEKSPDMLEVMLPFFVRTN